MLDICVQFDILFTYNHLLLQEKKILLKKKSKTHVILIN